MHPMNRQQVLNILRQHKPILEERFGVTELTLFGSFARDQATEDSDVDVIVKFNGPATSKGYFGTVRYLEELLGRTVDLATEKSLRDEIRPFVERDINMSETSDKPRRWDFYLKDMIRYAETTLELTKGLDQDAFVSDIRDYLATLKSIEMIGEAAAQIPPSVKEAHPNIPWGDIIGVRNRIAHFYSGIDNDVVWKIIQTDIPTLIPQLEKLLADEERETP